MPLVFALAAAMGITACDKKRATTEGGPELLYRTTPASNHQLAVAGGYLWFHGTAQRGGENYSGFLRLPPSADGTPLVVGEWDGSRLGPKIAVDDQNVYRVNYNALEKYEFNGSKVGEVALPSTSGEVLRLNESGPYALATTDGCANVFIVDKQTMQLVTVTTGSSPKGGPTGLAYFEGAVFCTGNDYIFKIDPQSGDILVDTITADLESGVEETAYGELIPGQQQLLMSVLFDGLYYRLSYLDTEAAVEGMPYANQDVATFTSWAPERSSDAFLVNASYGPGTTSLVRVQLATGEARRVTPEQETRERKIGAGFGTDSGHLYWVRIATDAQEIVRFPRDELDEPFP